MYQLINDCGQVMGEFETISACQEYCLEKKICNVGWVRRSLKTGEKMYMDSKPYKDYKGFGWSVRKL